MNFILPVQHSPGGSLFPYYYKNGEIHCLKYGSFHSDEAALFALMRAEEEFLARQGRKLPTWVDFYETKRTNRVLVEFVENIHRLENHLTKMAIVGLSFSDQWRYRYIKLKSGHAFPFPVRFFSDPEEAKTWLVGEAA